MPAILLVRITAWSDMDTMPVVGMAYVPMQQLKTMYEPEDGFVRGNGFS